MLLARNKFQFGRYLHPFAVYNNLDAATTLLLKHIRTILRVVGKSGGEIYLPVIVDNLESSAILAVNLGRRD